MKPTLRFTEKAYRLWRALCVSADTEIGAFGWATREDDPLLVTELWVPKQECTSGSVDREPEETGRCIKAGLERGLTIGQCTRIWLHTHPGDSATPSGTDERYWDEMTNGGTNGSGHRQHGHVMGIMAKGGETFARLALRDEYHMDLEIDVRMVRDADWEDAFKTQAKLLIAENVSRPRMGYNSPYSSDSKSDQTWEERQAAASGYTKQVAVSLPAMLMPPSIPKDSVYIASGYFKGWWKTPAGAYIKSPYTLDQKDLAHATPVGSGSSSEGAMIPLEQATRTPLTLPPVAGRGPGGQLSNKQRKQLAHKTRLKGLDLKPLNQSEYQLFLGLQELADDPAGKITDEQMRNLMDLHMRYTANLNPQAIA